MSNIYGRQVVVPLTNKSGGALVAGDVVIVDTSNNEAVTTTTTARSETSLGVVQEAIASNATGRVLIAGYAALVNVPASVTRGHYVETHTVAKQATGSSSRRSGSFGQFLTGGTTPTALLWGTTDQTASTAGTLATVDQDIAADTTTNNTSTWTDVTGMTGISVPAGTYIALIDIESECTTNYGPVFRLTDGTTIYAQAGLIDNHIATVSQHTMFHAKPFVLGSTTTMKLQYFTDTTMTIKKYPTRGASSTAVATHVTFVKIA